MFGSVRSIFSSPFPCHAFPFTSLCFEPVSCKLCMYLHLRLRWTTRFAFLKIVPGNGSTNRSRSPPKSPGKLNKQTTRLTLPSTNRYLAWLSFATYLTVGVGILNDWDIKDKEVPKSPSAKDTKVRTISSHPSLLNFPMQILLLHM